MSLAQSVAVVGHLLAAVILVGSTVMMALVVVPSMRRDRLSPQAVRAIGQRFSIVTAVAGVAVFVTGVYVTSINYTVTALFSTVSGAVVLASIAVWVALTVVLTVGTDRLARSVAVGDTREAALRSQRWYNLAVGISIVGLAMSRLAL